ncbi:SDR family oxidoreductase [Nocardia sp. NPDC059240]|uniref:SDR family oxidoreductase n=1 Tax=Nocardia sp. NPDC059240 TaxID=3346786 RepID=UPI0036B34132
MSESVQTAVVTGASRGFGRGIAAALVGAGMRVIGVARDEQALGEVRDELGDAFVAVVADATDEAVAEKVIRVYQPRLLVLNAGASPHAAPIHEQTWETFSRNWSVDTKHAFVWVGAALREPLAPGSTVIALSSGAALNGSPLSGGYAGAKSTIRFIRSYAAVESDRAALDIRFVALLPRLTPTTGLGADAVAAYAAREGKDVETYIAGMGPVLTPEQVGKAVVELAGDPDSAAEYLVSGAGLQQLG